MSKHIQAYFNTESEAEHVRTLLQTYNVEGLEVGRLDGGYKGDSRVIVPIYGVGFDTSAGTGVTGNGAGIAPAAVVSGIDDDLDLDGHHKLEYVLSVKVLEEDYEEIRNLVRHNRGHVERVD